MPLHVLACYRLDRSFQRRTFRGILDHFAEVAGVDVLLDAPDRPQAPGLTAVDGVVGAFSPEMPPPAICRDVPTISTSNTRVYPGVGRVVSDDVQVGRTGARHLLDRGYRSHGFVVGSAEPLPRYARERWVGWRRELAAAGIAEVPEVLSLDSPDLVERIRGLPRPLALMASLDWEATDVMRICQEHGLRLPEDVAVIGVNDDDLLCDAVRPALSSIDLNRRRVGQEAAAEILRLIRGQVQGPRVLRFPPRGAVARQSSSPVPVHDPLVLRAAEWIQQSITEPMTVEQMAGALQVSRRSLELAFKRELGRSPLAEIRRVRIERAQMLLRQTPHTICRVAAACGFADQRYFSTTFRRATGETPSAYRARQQASGRPG